MTNKLTDAEVKKALEICASEHLGCEDGCPLKEMNCRFEMPKLALDRINHLEGENEKNENIIRIADKTIATLNAENESLKAEIERLNTNISAMATTLSTSARATRHEAYKELAEKVKSEARYFAANVPDVCEVIDNLLNELVGD